jgi:hypothetical protein
LVLAVLVLVSIGIGIGIGSIGIVTSLVLDDLIHLQNFLSLSLSLSLSVSPFLLNMKVNEILSWSSKFYSFMRIAWRICKWNNNLSFSYESLKGRWYCGSINLFTGYSICHALQRLKLFEL